MCGRFARTSPVETFANLFHAQGMEELPPAYNIAPTQNLLVARNMPNGNRELVNLHWGLVPRWSKGPDPKYSMLNARAETLATKPAYRDPFKQRRCLIAADGFYEWKKASATKQPYFIRLRGGQPCAFAGLWDYWVVEGEAPIASCTIITCDANQLVAGIHDRMPVILPPKLYDSWMNPKQTFLDALSELLKPYPDTLMEAWPVGREVNSPRNNSVDLLEPVTHPDNIT